jgi:hypothetical protein
MANMSFQQRYETLLEHLRHHNVRKWLQCGAHDERAHTIAKAICRLTDEQLNRRMARMLAKNEP